MTAVSATDFAKEFGRYKEEAQRQPIAITTHGRVSGYFISAREYAELQRLRVLERHAYRLNELPREIIESIANAKMNSDHDHLNSLMTDK